MKQTAHDIITSMLVGRLQKYVKPDSSLNKTICSEIYQDIFFSLSEIVKNSSSPLSNEAVNLLAQMYYDSVIVNGGKELDPNIFTQRATFDNVTTKEIAFLAKLTEGSPFYEIFVSKIKRRS